MKFKFCSKYLFIILLLVLAIFLAGCCGGLITPATDEAMIKVDMLAVDKSTVDTDNPDYSPGDYVLVTGSGWLPGETVKLDFLETLSDPISQQTITYYTVADNEGKISDIQYLIELRHVGATFILTATGQTSGLVATTTFTDAGMHVSLAGVKYHNYPSRKNFVNVVKGTDLSFTLNIKVTGLPGPGNPSVDWRLRYATTGEDPQDNAQLLGVTPELPATGTYTKGDPDTLVPINIATTDLALQTYVGHLIGERTAGESASPDDFYFEFTVMSPPVNHTPTISANDGSITVNEGQTANNAGNYSDADGDTVNITASVGSINKTGTSSGTWSWSFATTDGSAQSQQVTITANDGQGGITTTTFNLIVNNVAPIVAITNAPTSSPEGTMISLGSTVTDPSSVDTAAGFTYAWGVTKDGNSYATDSTQSFSFTPDDNATYVVTLDVTDKDGGTGTDSASITVNNVAPTVAITGAPTSSPEGTMISLGSTVTDPSSVDTAAGFTYAWGVTKDGNSYATDSTQSFSFTPDDNATYVVTLDVTDKDGGTGTDSASITVLNVAPTATFNFPTDPVILNSQFSLSLTGPYDPSDVDTTAGFEYAFDPGDDMGYGLFSSNNTASFTATSVGFRTVKGKIQDKDGGVTEYDAEVSVIYHWDGFFRPVDNLPTGNTAKAGSAIPVKFSLSGNQGLSIFAAGYPKPVKITCGTTDTLDDIEETVTAGNSSLNYDAAADQYIYVWKTEKTWTGCRQLIVKLNDGTSHEAYFTFKK